MEIITPKQHISALRQENIDHLTPGNYRNDFERENNIETGTILGYHGREILELLQNADDAYTLYLKQHPNAEIPKEGIPVLFEYKNKKLRVSNYGAPFDIESITSLSQGNNSTKDRGEFIGNKGIGFRALLNWCDDIKIFSGDFSVHFSSEIAKKYLEDLKSKNEKVRESCEKDSTLCIPMLSTPEWDDDDRKENGYDTTIELNVINDSDNMGVMSQVNAFDAYTLIFLRNVSCVKFETETQTIEYKKDVFDENGKKKVSLKKITLGQIEEMGDFYYFDQYDGTFGPKYAIAVPCNFDKNFRGKMYTFFPILDKHCPFPLLMHSTFDLSPNRNTINAGEKNRELFKELLEFFVKYVTKYFTTKENMSGVLSLITPINFSTRYEFDEPFAGLFKDYLDICKKYVKLQTVNDEFLAITEELKLNDDYPKHFKGPEFKKLIKKMNDDAFLQMLVGNDSYYSSNELFEKINSLGETKDPLTESSIRENVETFDWWVRKYKLEMPVPNVMMDQKGKWVHKGTKCLFPKDGDNKAIELPEWAELKILNEYYCNAFVEYVCDKYDGEILFQKTTYKSKPSNKRVVIDLYRDMSPIEFKEYSAANLVSPLNTLVGNDLGRCLQLLKWLLLYQEDVFETEIDSIAFRLPDSELNVVSAKQLYFGVDYGKEFELTESLFKFSDKHKRICAPSEFGFKKEDADFEKLMDLLKKMEVLKRPPIKEVHYLHETPFALGFDDYLYNEMSARDSEVNTTCEYFCDDRIVMRCIDPCFLQEPDPRDVFQWLLEIEEKYVAQKIDSIWFKAKRSKKYYYQKPFSYLHFYLKKARWLKINDTYFSLDECFLTEDSYLKKVLPSCITQQELKKWSTSSAKIRDIKNFLKKMDVPDSFTQLPSDTLYGLLIKLSEDNSREAKDVTRRIYRQCFAAESDELERITAESKNRTRFMKEGLVLCKNDGQFHHHSAVYFTNKVVVNISKKNLLDMKLRNGSAANAKLLFFVEEYSENIALTKFDNAVSDQDFQKKFRDYIPYVYCYRRDTANDTEKKSFREWRIHLSSHTDLADVPDFTALQYEDDEKKESGWVITVPPLSFVDILASYKNEFFDALEQIVSMVLKSENSDFLQKLVNFFFAGDGDRKHIIEKDFGDFETTIKGCRDELFGEYSSSLDLERYLRSAGLWDDSLKMRIDAIDFSPWNSDLSNKKRLRDLLVDLNVSQEDFEKWMERSYSFKDLNMSSLKKCFRREEKKFVSALWKDCSKDDEKKKGFEKEKRSLEYELFETVEFEGLTFDAEEILSGIFKNRFGQDLASVELVDVNSIYSDNFQKLECTDVDINGFFNHNPEYKSLLFFDVEPTKTRLKQWAEEKKKKEECEKNDKSKPLPKIVVPSNVPGYGKQPQKTDSGRRGQGRGTVSSAELKRQAEENENLGLRAEKIIYTELNKIINNEPDACHELKTNLHAEFELVGSTLEWKSGNAEKEGMPNCSDKLGYDMEIRGANGEMLYIEVKGSRGNKCSFFMSDNEFEVAKEKGKDYRVIFVGNANEDPVFPSVLPSNFLTEEDYGHEESIQYRIYKKC